MLALAGGQNKPMSVLAAPTFLLFVKIQAHPIQDQKPPRVAKQPSQAVW